MRSRTSLSRLAYSSSVRNARVSNGAGRSNGTYTLQWFSKALTNEGDRFESNSGSNFSATFTVVPEPAAAMLGLIGTVGLLRRRR